MPKPKPPARRKPRSISVVRRAQKQTVAARKEIARLQAGGKTSVLKKVKNTDSQTMARNGGLWKPRFNPEKAVLNYIDNIMPLEQLPEIDLIATEMELAALKEFNKNNLGARKKFIKPGK